MTAALEVSGQQHGPVALYPRERPGTHSTGGWVGPRAGLDGRKISSPLGFFLYSSHIYCLMILHSSLHPFQPPTIKRTGRICTVFHSSPFVILHHSPPDVLETFSLLLTLCSCYILLLCIVCSSVLSLLLGPCDKDVLISNFPEFADGEGRFVLTAYSLSK